MPSRYLHENVQLSLKALSTSTMSPPVSRKLSPLSGRSQRHTTWLSQQPFDTSRSSVNPGVRHPFLNAFLVFWVDKNFTNFICKLFLASEVDTDHRHDCLAELSYRHISFPYRREVDTECRHDCLTGLRYYLFLAEGWILTAAMTTPLTTFLLQ